MPGIDYPRTFEEFDSWFLEEENCRKYLIKTTERGMRRKKHLLNTLAMALSGSASVITTNTIIKSPAVLIHLLKEISVESAHTMLTPMYT